MTINSSGMWCDGCGKPIGLEMLMSDDEVIPYFNMKLAGVDTLYQICEVCDPQVRAAVEAGDWAMMPDGPLKNTYYCENTREVQNE